MSRPARAGVRSRAGALPDAATIAARRAVALALSRVAAVRGRAGGLARQRLHAAARVARARPPRSAWRGSGSRTTPCRHPSLSFKDRVVASALNAALGLGLDTVGCASTGNLANAVAAQAARAGLPAWIFIPHDLELGKVVGTAVYGPHLVRVRGTYDDVNRLCAQAADRFGWGLVNINLRGYYGEGSKTMAFEIAEQLGWRLPTAVVAPMAGGSLLTKLEKGFREFADAGLVSGARAAALRRAGRRVRADRAAGGARRRHARAGGARHDRALDRDRESGGRPLRGRAPSASTGGWAAAVSETRWSPGIRLLAETTGVFTETAGGVDRGRRAGAGRGRAASGRTTRWCSASPATDSRPSRRSQGALPEAPHHRAPHPRTGGPPWP